MARKEFRGRSASVYLPSKECYEEWLKDAEKYGCTISQYIFEMAERGRHSQDGERPDLVRDNSELKSQVRKLEQDLLMLKINLENSQAEIYKLRFGNFEEADQDSARGYDRTLVEMLKRSGVLDSREILAGLSIDPKDSQSMKLVANQLEELKRFGLVQENLQGWRWV